MSELNFNSVGPFQDNLSNSERGKLAGYLTKACRKVPEAWPAADLLGDLTNTVRRDQALRHLNGMGSLSRRHVLAHFGKHLSASRLSRD